MIVTRPDIGFLRTDDDFILRFLRARKFDQMETFRLLAQYFQFRQQNLDMFQSFKVRFCVFNNEPSAVCFRSVCCVSLTRGICVLWFGCVGAVHIPCCILPTSLTVAPHVHRNIHSLMSRETRSWSYSCKSAAAAPHSVTLTKNKGADCGGCFGL